MEQGAIEILRKHGCLYMKDDYKALFEELEAYYKPTEVVENNAVLPLVSNNEVAVCDCTEDYVCELCYKDKEWIIKDGRFQKQTDC